MLKFIFICLLIAIALLFALGRGYLTNPISEAHQPERLLQQQNSDHLTLISSSVANTPIVVPDTEEQPKLEAIACLEWGPFQTTDINQIEPKLKTLAFGNRQSRQNVQDTLSSIVYIPSLGSKEAADKKAIELSHLGVNDYYIIQDQSNLRWGISLGVFKTESAARQLLATLVSKGVHSAKVGVRTAATNKVNYVFRNVSSEEKLGLDNLKGTFPAQILQVCR